MKWGKHVYPAKKPEVGDTRSFYRFAFFPMKIGAQWVWLEQFEQVQVYREHAETLTEPAATLTLRYKRWENYVEYTL